MVQLGIEKKSETIQDMKHRLLISTQHTDTQHNPIVKDNKFGPRLDNSLPKYEKLIFALV